MPVPMPAAVVLIVCKTAIAGPEDPNADYTGAENLEWATEHSMMVCRRQEVQLYDRAEAMGAAAVEAAELIADLLTLARRGRYDMVPTDLNAVVNTCLESLAFER